MKRLKVLHLHSSFSAGGKELRAAKLMNAFGSGIEHVLVSGVPDQMGAAAAIDPAVSVTYPNDFPALSGKPTPWRLFRLAQAMRGFDLVLTYNWGAMDAVAAHWLCRAVLRLPPLVHHEDGFNQDETARLNPRRSQFRRVVLAAASAVVVPSRKLEGIARDVWRVPAAKLRRIANGIDLAAYSGPVMPGALPGLTKCPGDLWLGTLAGLRAVKNLPRLVRAFHNVPEPWRLVIIGEGPERGAIEAQAAEFGMQNRVFLPGFAPDPARVVGLFDLFALSSDSEQFPISVVEAMAAGLAVAAPDVGDVRAMVSEENQPFITQPDDDSELAAAITVLAENAEMRANIGAANRVLALAEYDEAGMVARYRAVYSQALGRANFP